MRLVAAVSAAVALVATGAGGAKTMLPASQLQGWHQVTKQEIALRLKQHTNGILRSKCRSSFRGLASLTTWRTRHVQAHKARSACPVRPPHYAAWLCIHRGEGSWTSNTGNGFYGGLQMDYGFQSTYGPELLRSKGTADNWTPLEQMWVAERAWRSRGFYPWPNTARMCGLL